MVHLGRDIALLGTGQPNLEAAFVVQLIPVLDVQNRVVVRGVGGRREEYKPIVSQLTSSVDPVEVARALVDAVNAHELYLADLDAIRGCTPALDVYRAIRKLGVDLWVDAGIADVDSATTSRRFRLPCRRRAGNGAESRCAQGNRLGGRK